MKINVGILLLLSISQCCMNVNGIESKKNIENVFNAFATVFKLNTTMETFNQTAFLQQILDAPDDLDVLSLVIIGSQNFFLFYNDNYGEIITEYWEEWIDIVTKFASNGAEGVTLKQLKPFFLLISQKNSTFAPIVNAINEYLYEDNLGNESFIDLVLFAPDEVTLQEIIVIAFQNYFLIPIEEAQEKPENFEEIQELIIEVVTIIQTDPEGVTMQQLKPIIEFIWNYFLFPPISMSTNTTTEVVDSTSLSTKATSLPISMSTSTTTEIVDSTTKTTSLTSTMISIVNTVTVINTTKSTLTSALAEVTTANFSGLSSVELGIVIGAVSFIVLVITITAIVVLFIYRKKSTTVSTQETDKETTL